MEQFMPIDTEVKAMHNALAHGHPVKLRHEGRDLAVYFVQMEGTAPAVHCAAMADRTGVDYTLVLPLDAATWEALMAQLPG